MEKICFSKSSLSEDDLEDYRNEDGFIDLNEIGLNIEKGSRNQIGSTDIFKYWVDFNGSKVLLKQEKSLDGEQNGTIYSELIMNQLCEEMRIRSAKTDAFTLNGFKGIMSYVAFDPKEQNMIMTRELIGDDVKSDGDCFDFESLEQKIKKELVEQFGISEKEAEVIKLKRRLQKIIQLYSSEMDNHLENEGFLYSRDENGKYKLRVCPLFDNELSFGLHANLSDLMQDNIYDSLQYNTPKLRQALVDLNSGKSLSDEVVQLINEISNKEEIANLLIGNIQLRNRVMGNGKQIVLDDSKTPKYYSKSDATLAYLYNDSKGKVENPEGIDQDIVNLHGTIAGFIEDLRDIDMAKIIEYVEDTIKIPQIVKTQLMRFAGVKKEVLTFVESRQIGEVEYYDKKAEKLMKKALNISRNNEINEIS